MLRLDNGTVLTDNDLRNLKQALSNTTSAPIIPAPSPAPSPAPAPSALPANATLITTTAWNAGFIQAVPQGGTLVMPFVPAVAHPQINFANYTGSPVARTVTVSTRPCDFRTTIDPSGVNGPIAGKFGGIGSLYPTLVPGQQYYLNISDLVWSSGDSVCKTPNCGDVIVTIK